MYLNLNVCEDCLEQLKIEAQHLMYLNNLRRQTIIAAQIIEAQHLMYLNTRTK